MVDTSIEGYETLPEDLDEGNEILLLDGDADGLQQIADCVEGRDDISSIHILSHGEDGELHLGTTVIDSNNIGEFESLLESIGQSLTEDGDILIYGCNCQTLLWVIEALECSQFFYRSFIHDS